MCFAAACVSLCREKQSMKQAMRDEGIDGD